MSVEIEVSSRILKTTLILAGMLILLVIGYISTPVVGGKAALLTPQTREIVRYRRSAQEWIAILGNVDEQMGMVLDDDSGMDLLERVQAVSRAQMDVSGVLRGIDRTSVPVTMNTLNADIAACAATHLDAVSAMEAWVNEPMSQRATQAKKALQSANACVEKLRSNSLLQEE